MVYIIILFFYLFYRNYLMNNFIYPLISYFFLPMITYVIIVYIQVDYKYFVKLQLSSTDLFSSTQFNSIDVFTSMVSLILSHWVWKQYSIQPSLEPLFKSKILFLFNP